MEHSNILGFDYGKARIGLAVYTKEVKVARPLIAIPNDKNLWASVKIYIDDYKIEKCVVGRPRNLDGGTTAQTNEADEFAKELGKKTGLPVEMQDEALTSVNAQEILASSKRNHQKGEVDALAASLILSDYVSEKGS